jgi:hypothetical protein
MPAIEITGAEIAGGNTLVVRVKARNDTNMNAEISGSIGGPGINAQFSPEKVAPETIVETSYGIAIDSSLYGSELLGTVTLSEEGVNTGDYPDVDEQRNITIQDSTSLSLSDPLFGGGGTVTGEPGPIDGGGSDGGTGGTGGSGGSDTRGEAINSVSIIGADATANVQVAELSYTIENTNSLHGVKVNVELTEGVNGRSKESSFVVGSGERMTETARFFFSNDNDIQAELCANITSASWQ